MAANSSLPGTARASRNSPSISASASNRATTCPASAAAAADAERASAPERGELTLVIEGAPEPDEVDWTAADAAIADLAEHVPAALLRDVLGRLLDVPRRPLYQRILAAKDEA